MVSVWVSVLVSVWVLVLVSVWVWVLVSVWVWVSVSVSVSVWVWVNKFLAFGRALRACGQTHKFPMKQTLKDLAWIVGLCLFILLIVTLVVGRVWVAIHYIVKFW